MNKENDYKQFAHLHLGLAHEITAHLHLGGHPLTSQAQETVERLKVADTEFRAYAKYGTSPAWMPTNAPDKTKRSSALLQEYRSLLLSVRSQGNELACATSVRDRAQCIDGVLTCAIATLYGIIDDVMEEEIKADDVARGKSYVFRPRGVGLDTCPGCFVCGAAKRSKDANDYLNNVSGFVRTKEEGERIVQMFVVEDGEDPNASRARLDFRPSEPNWIQLKVGACDAHLPNLEALVTMTGKYGRIRQRDVEDARLGVVFDYSVRSPE